MKMSGNDRDVARAGYPAMSRAAWRRLPKHITTAPKLNKAKVAGSGTAAWTGVMEKVLVLEVKTVLLAVA